MLKWLLLLFFPLSLAAQPAVNDPALDSIEKYLPENWVMERSGNEVVISCKDSVWLCREIAYDYLSESDTVVVNGQPTRHVQSLSGGKKSRAYIRFHIDTFYNESQINAMRLHNEDVEKKIQKINDSSWLPRTIINARPGLVLNLTKREKKELARVMAAKEAVYRTRKKIPDYTATIASLYVVSFNGNGQYGGSRGKIVPPTISREWNYITQTLLPRFSKTISNPF